MVEIRPTKIMEFTNDSLFTVDVRFERGKCRGKCRGSRKLHGELGRSVDIVFRPLTYVIFAFVVASCISVR